MGNCDNCSSKHAKERRQSEDMEENQWLIKASAAVCLIGVLACATVYWERVPNCPHGTFLERHFCQECFTPQDALKFSGKRHDTMVNTVILGENRSYEELDFGKKEAVSFWEEEKCANFKKAKVAECFLNRNVCRLEGTSCITYHATNNGHMFYRETIC